ncbi:hypothetical protein B0T19DRAFT_433032 [Cercophora scortea]|uniref:C2H2-type domain-containing protein n=1 Tax=Cercophora scortea TaxID=314031 RepID=A0AAE0I775_9PEZI|nr:hypothetical protein B0T19DRAFT_433032 [Cercophora scortea]
MTIDCISQSRSWITANVELHSQTPGPSPVSPELVRSRLGLWQHPPCRTLDLASSKALRFVEQDHAPTSAGAKRPHADMTGTSTSTSGLDSWEWPETGKRVRRNSCSGDLMGNSEPGSEIKSASFAIDLGDADSSRPRSSPAITTIGCETSSTTPSESTPTPTYKHTFGSDPWVRLSIPSAAGVDQDWDSDDSNADDGAASDDSNIDDKESDDSTVDGRELDYYSDPEEDADADEAETRHWDGSDSDDDEDDIEEWTIPDLPSRPKPQPTNSSSSSPSQEQATQTTPKVQYIPCPFSILHPEKYHSCATTTNLRSIRSVRRHILAHHRRPHYCPTCFATFHASVLCDIHIRGRTCQRSAPTDAALEGVREDEMGDLERWRADPAMSPREQWLSIWDTIFPGEKVRRPSLSSL